MNRILGFTEGVNLDALEGTDSTALETDVFKSALQALCDDLNTPKALGALNSALQSLKSLSPEEREPASRDLARMLLMLGLPALKENTSADTAIPQEVEALAQQRQEARAARNWAEADKLRAALLESGWEVRDTSDSFELKEVGVSV